MSHTPGPWKTERRTATIAIVDNEQMILGEVYGATTRPKLEWHANARLIAAAPDLLEACKLALSHVSELRDAWQRGALSERDGHGGERSNRNVDVEVALRDAIAKAEEKQ